LNRGGAIELESPEQTLYRFRSGLRDDYRRELIARGITTLEQAYQQVTDLDESRGSYFNQTDFRDNSKKATTSKPSFSRALPTPSKPASSSSSIKPTGPSGAKPITSERRAVSEPGSQPKNPMLQVSRYGHLAGQRPSQTKTLFVEIPIEDIEREDDGEVVVHQQDNDSDHSSWSRSRPSTRRTLRRIGLGDSDRYRAIRAKRYIESSKNSEKITTNLKKM